MAVERRGDDAPHLFTPYPDGAPPELPPDHLHAPLQLELDDEGREATVLADLVGGGRVAVDEFPAPLRRLLEGREVVPAATLLGPARVVKTVDDLACIRQAQRINELAMVSVQRALAPGVRQTELSAQFLRAAWQLGIHANAIDPIWQVMPETLADGPWTTHSSVAFPTPTTDRFVRDGDVVWVDTGVVWNGYASDFGRTFLVGRPPRPSDRHRARFGRWWAVMLAVLEQCKPGATALDREEGDR